VVIEGPAPADIVNVKFRVTSGAPVADPVTAIVYDPAANIFVLFKVTVTALPGTTDAGENVTLVPAGAPVDVNEIGFTNPPFDVVGKEILIVAGAGHAATAGAGDPRSNPVGNGTAVLKKPRP
jgi:hypothetical protein